MAKIIQPVQPSQVDRLRNLPVAIANSMLQQWVSGFIQLWGQPIQPIPENAPKAIRDNYDAKLEANRAHSEKILAELGTDAAALLDHSADLLTFIMPRLPEEKTPGISFSRAEINLFLSHKPDTITHEDGTVTLA